MTKKPNPLEDPPTASSSEDDEAETSSGEEEDSSSEEEDDPKPPSAAATKPTVSATATKPTASATAKNQKSDSDSGSGSESDSEPDEPPKNPNPGSGKSTAAAVTSTNPKKKESLPSSATLALPALKSGTKRPSEGTSRDDGNAKRPKKDTTSGDDTKKPAFQRLWSEADEISLLNAMISFKTEKGISPYADSNQFYEYVKKLISIEVSKNQLMDKLRSLKNKYLGKEKNGKEVSFTKPHDVEAYSLAKSIWGVDGMALESAKLNGLSKKSQTKMKKLESVKQDLFSSQNVQGGDLEMSDWFEDSFLVRSIARFGVDERTVKEGWRSAPVEAKKRIEAEMKALRVKELEYVVLKAQFLSEAVSMIAEVIKHRDM